VNGTIRTRTVMASEVKLVCCYIDAVIEWLIDHSKSVTLCTTARNIHNLNNTRTSGYLCVLHESHNKQRLFCLKTLV